MITSSSVPDMRAAVETLKFNIDAAIENNEPAPSLVLAQAFESFKKTCEIIKFNKDVPDSSQKITPFVFPKGLFDQFEEYQEEIRVFLEQRLNFSKDFSFKHVVLWGDNWNPYQHFVCRTPVEVAVLIILDAWIDELADQFDVDRSYYGI